MNISCRFHASAGIPDFSGTSFCPSCHQKRVFEFGEWLCEEVLKHVPHRQWVFSIPKRIRVFFMTNRRLLAKLSQRTWKVLSAYLKAGVRYDDAVPALMSPVLTSRAMRKSWVRLIQKIYHVDPLLCPKCKGTMKVIAFIEEPAVIRKILVHLDLWVIRNHDPPVGKNSEIQELTYDDAYSQLPFSDAWA